MEISKRDIRLAISVVLSKHNIDDLALEGELATAVFKLWTDPELEESDFRLGESVIDTYINAHEKIKQREEIIRRVEIALKLNVSDKWESVIDFIVRKDEEGQTIEAYQEWRCEDPFNSPKAHQIAQNPKLIIATWPQVFSNDDSVYMQDYDGGIDL